MGRIPPSDAELCVVREDEKNVLKNLWNLYAHDMSDYRETIEINEDGSFPFPDIDLYFSKSYLHPLLIRVNGKIAGFILISEPPYFKYKVDYGIEEFFILRKYRRNGVGSAVINRIFDMYKGKYWYIILEKNQASRNLFKKILNNKNIKCVERLKDFDEATKCYDYNFTVE